MKGCGLLEEGQVVSLLKFYTRKDVLRMKKECVNYYQMCRENAGLTQEQASELLHVSKRTLQNYESGSNVADEIVLSMVEVYNTPLLAWWHMKHNNPLGKYLPEIVLPKTEGDMAFQTILSQDEIDYIVTTMKKIMLDGKIDYYEICDLEKCINVMKVTSGKLLSAAAFGEIYMEEYKKNGEFRYEKERNM